MEYKTPRFSHHEQYQSLENRWKQQEYHLEQKDGSLKKFTMDLKSNAQDLLQGIADALKTTGMSAIKAPPVPDFNTSEISTSRSILRSTMRHGTGDFRIHSSFDAKRGRDLMHFLSHLNADEAKSRKASRLDASSAALVVRQLYKFQAIDGTGLGWSSASLAKCLMSLTKLFDEHHHKLKVKSFYPLRLFLTNDEFQDQLDLFGGAISLNPGSTQIQWLEIMMTISDESIKQLELNRGILHDNQLHVQNALNVRIRKGFSCTSREYFDFLQDMSTQPILHEESNTSSSAIAPERVQIIVESAQASRRATVTNNGEIRVSSGMNFDSIMSSVRKLRGKAWHQRIEEDHKQSQSKDLAALLQYELGSKVFKSRLHITSEQYLSCLNALLVLPEETKAEIKKYLAGNNLGITGMGRSCHLGDDGSILIPCDWR